jgi:multidrug efflux system membrane fusion protein
MDEEKAKDPPPNGEPPSPDTEAWLSGEEPPKVVVSPADAETYLSGGEPLVTVSPEDAETYLSGYEPGAKPEDDKPAQQPAPPPRKKWHWIAPFLLFLLALFLVLHFCGGSKSTTAGNKGASGASGVAQGAAITVGQSKTGNMNIYVDALGTVTPIATVTLYSQITGRVMNVYYHEGQTVQAGDPLVDIDPRPYESTLLQAEGTLERDMGVLAQARMDLARYQAAWERNAIAKQQLDDQAATVAQDEGTVKADQGSVDYDRVQLAYCHIVAPITGRVGLRLVDPGNTVFSGTASTLVVITQLQPITVVFNVSEDDLAQVQAQLKNGQQLEVDAYDRTNEKEIETGKLTSLDNEVDTTTGTVKFRAEFPNKNLTLFPNQFVNARLLVKTLRQITLVPSAAVQQNGTSAFVYIVNADNKVAMQSITVLANDDQNTAVQGVSPGVNLATSGFDRLESGALVAVRGASGAQGASGPSGRSTGRRFAAGSSGKRPGPAGSSGHAVNQPNRQGSGPGATSPAAPNAP